MREPAYDSARGPGVLLPLMSVLTLIFAGLWLLERSKLPEVKVVEIPRRVEVPKTIVKEVRVPVEKIKEVPKEVIKEVPVQLTAAQQAALEFSSNYVAASSLTDLDDALYKLDSVCVRVNMKEDVKRVVSENLVRNRCEVALRNSGLHVDADSPYVLGLNYDGIWNETETYLVYSMHIVLFDSVALVHRNDVRRTFAIIWTHNTMGFAEKNAAEQVILGNAETNAVLFARKFMATQERIR